MLHHVTSTYIYHISTSTIFLNNFEVTDAAIHAFAAILCAAVHAFVQGPSPAQPVQEILEISMKQLDFPEISDEFS